MLSQVEKKYSPNEKFPLGWYAFATVVFNALLADVIRSEKGREKETSTAQIRDLVILGMATHKIARIITKDEVTNFIRAPFTRYQESLGYGEVNEAPRGSGGIEFIGELLTCNYCMSAWVGLGLFFGFSRFPKQTRSVSAFFSALTAADFLHVVYEERRTHANVLTLQEEKLDQKKKAS